MRYDTRRTKYGESSGVAEVEVKPSEYSNCTLLFLLSTPKVQGDNGLECHNTTCFSGVGLTQHVRIRQNSSDGWAIEKMQIQTYPGSSNFNTYSLDGKSPSFWVDGNTDTYDKPSCTDGNWCTLSLVDDKGNPIHIIILS